MTVEQAAEIFGLGHNAIRTWCRRGILPAYRTSYRWVIAARVGLYPERYDPRSEWAARIIGTSPVKIRRKSGHFVEIDERKWRVEAADINRLVLFDGAHIQWLGPRR